MMHFIDLHAPYKLLQESIKERINSVLEHGQYIMGPEVQELEEVLAEYVGVKHCITVSSGTEAILISLMSIGIKPGDEIITTPFSFIAAAEVIAFLGAKPIFVDIELSTCNINVSLLEEKISPRTKAIIPVSLFGQPADMSEINLIAAKYKVFVIEDAAQSFGSTYQGKKSCNLSAIGCTSFFPSKTLGCYGDGGAIFTDDDDLAKDMKEIRVHGQSERYVHNKIGVGGRMDTIQCAILLAKFKNFEWEINQRIKIGEFYNELLSGSVRFITQKTDRQGVYAQYTIIIDDRDNMKKFLFENNIPTAVHYPLPINLQFAYKDLCCDDCCIESLKASKMVLSLPMHPYLNSKEQINVANKIKEFLSINP